MGEKRWYKNEIIYSSRRRAPDVDADPDVDALGSRAQLSTLEPWIALSASPVSIELVSSSARVTSVKFAKRSLTQ